MAPAGLDVQAVRKEFPILSRELSDGHPLAYWDSANTSHKPRCVIDAVDQFYAESNANVARAVHQLGAVATDAFERARTAVGRFIGAPNTEDVIFTKNASEALNLVARVLGDAPTVKLGPGRKVVISEMEHHSNIVPWQQLCARTGATLDWYRLTDDGQLDLDSVQLDDSVAVVSVTWVSNALGTINPVHDVVAAAKKVGAITVLDGSQAVPQLPVDVAAIGADFMAFTGHKMCGPTGIGVLWGRQELLQELPPFLGGGEMIDHVTMAESSFAPPPAKFEAGTPPIAQAVGLGAAVAYLESLGMANVRAHEEQITRQTLAALQDVPGVTIMGSTSPENRGGAVSFQMAGVHPHDIAQVLDAKGVAVRAGHHCAKPLHQRYGVASSIRVSPYVYTTTEEIDVLISGLHDVRRFFGVAETEGPS